VQPNRRKAFCAVCGLTVLGSDELPVEVTG